MKKKILGLIAVLVVLFAAMVAFGIWKIAPIGTAFTAKRVCSCMFLSKRTPESVINNELGLLRFFRLRIDRQGKTVESDFMGWANRKAIYRPGLGCTLVLNATEEETRAKTAELDFQEIPISPAPWPDWAIKDDLPKPDMKRLEQAVSEAFYLPTSSMDKGTRAVIVVHGGRIVAERYGPGFSQNTRLAGWSMTKSVINALVGIMVKEGRLSIEKTAPVPEWASEGDPRKQITLDQLMRMSSGLRFKEHYFNPLSDVVYMLFGSGACAAYAASRPLAAAPDEVWSYSSGTTNIISRIIRDTLGEQAEYLTFPKKALFDRLGMSSAVMEIDASGHFVGSSFMFATARDWARFGFLYLRDGVWDGERILPEGWVEYSSRPTPGAPQGCYGAQFWLNAGQADRPKNRTWPDLPPDIFFARGFEGQYVTMIPSHDLVVVRLGLTPNPHDYDHGAFLAKVIEAVESGKK